jgi:hypothetical protein
MRCGCAPAHGRATVEARTFRFALGGFCRVQASPADPNWFNINGLASSTSSAYPDMAGGAMPNRRTKLLQIIDQ